MTKLMRSALVGAAALVSALAGPGAQAATIIPFTFSAANGIASTSGSGSFTSAVNSGVIGKSDLTAFTLGGTASVLGGLFGGSYGFNGVGDLTSFSATLGNGGLSALSFVTVTKSFKLSFLGFVPAGSGSLAFNVNGVGPNNLTVTSPLPNAKGTLTVPLAGAVPEPATWAMMIGGVGLVGGALRRRRRAPARAAFA